MSIVAKIEKDIAALLPASVQSELGVFGAALYANVKHDLSVLKDDAKQLLASDFEQLWASVKASAFSVFTDPALLSAGYDMKLSAVIDILMADATKSGILTLVETLAMATLANLVRTAGAMAVAGLLAAA